MREADSSLFRSSGSWYGQVAALLIVWACLAGQHPALAADKATVERLRANLEQADYAGAGVCKSCHVDTAEHYSYTLHSAVFDLSCLARKRGTLGFTYRVEALPCTADSTHNN